MEEIFKPKQKTAYASLPFITRPARDERFMVFASEHDGFEALIHRDVQNIIQRKAVEAAPNETIGLLAGRVVRDERGPYTFVLAAEGARSSEVEATPSHVRISATGQSQVRGRLEAMAHGLDIIGWYHSHPRYSAVFSPVDITEQSTWRDPNHLGIVISGNDSEPLGVYRGPRASPLVRLSSIPPQLIVRRKIEQQVATAAEKDTHQAFVAEPTPASLDWFATRPGIFSLMLGSFFCGMSVGVLTLVLGFIWLDRRLNRFEERLLNSKVDSQQHPPAAPSTLAPFLRRPHVKQ